MAFVRARSNAFRSAFRSDSRSLLSAARVFAEIERELLPAFLGRGRFVGTPEL